MTLPGCQHRSRDHDPPGLGCPAHRDGREPVTLLERIDCYLTDNEQGQPGSGWDLLMEAREALKSTTHPGPRI